MCLLEVRKHITSTLWASKQIPNKDSLIELNIYRWGQTYGNYFGYVNLPLIEA